MPRHKGVSVRVKGPALACRSGSRSRPRPLCHSPHQPGRHFGRCRGKLEIPLHVYLTQLTSKNISEKARVRELLVIAKLFSVKERSSNHLQNKGYHPSEGAVAKLFLAHLFFSP